MNVVLLEVLEDTFVDHDLSATRAASDARSSGLDGTGLPIRSKGPAGRAAAGSSDAIMATSAIIAIKAGRCGLGE